MDVSRFDPSAQRNLIMARCSNDGAIGKRSVHVCTVTASARLTMECWEMHVETCQNRVTTGYNQLAVIGGGTHLIHKLPLIFELPSYMPVYLWFIQGQPLAPII
jgi:hypothetical protein